MQSSRLESDNRSFVPLSLFPWFRRNVKVGGIDTAEVFIDFREKIFHATCFFK